MKLFIKEGGVIKPHHMDVAFAILMENKINPKFAVVEGVRIIYVQPEDWERALESFVFCDICGVPTRFTKRCSRCWELETRIEGDPDLAQKILARVLGVET